MALHFCGCKRVIPVFEAIVYALTLLLYRSDLLMLQITYVLMYTVWLLAGNWKIVIQLYVGCHLSVW